MSNKKLPLVVWLAFATLCIVWGTTYFGIKITMEYFPPFFFSGVRHFVAGLIFLFIYLIIGERKRPTWKDFRYASWTGVFMITGGNALLSWSEKYISSGLAGILSAAAPLYITFMSLYFFKGFRLTGRILLGLFISIFGIALLSKPDAGVELTPLFWFGFALTLTANIFWGIGSIYMKRHVVEQHVFLKTAMQMIPASLVNLSISFIFEPLPNLAAVPSRGWWAVAYLIGVGSLIGYLTFVFCNKYMAPARLSIHVYVNTVVAVLVGWLFGGEALTWWTWFSMSIVLAGVILVNSEYARMQSVPMNLKGFSYKKGHY